MNKDTKRVFPCHWSIWLLLATFHLFSTAATFAGPSCPPGFTVGAFGNCEKPLIPSKKCSPFNGCSHGCITDLHGFPKCTCPTGYELHDDLKTCIWKLKQKKPLIPSKQCSQFNGCSHGCITDLHGFPKCTCPTGYVLHDDHKTCIWKLKQKKPLIPSKKCSPFNGCSHGCITDLHGFTKCTCPTGYELHDDLKTCIWKLKQKKPLIPSKKCSPFNGCSHGCITDLHGFTKCTCPTGYELHDDLKTCIWKLKQKKPLIPSKKCSPFNGCSHGCITDLHGFTKCTCPTGYELHDDLKTCIWKLKQKKPLIPSKQCSQFNGCSHGCITDLHGFPKCTCPTGYVLHDDHKTCIWKLKQKKPLIPSKQCSPFNGCSHGCIMDLHGFPKCTCPTGYELHDDLKTCIWKLKQKKPLIPSKKCSPFNGCSHGCITDLHGFTKCTCPTGYVLHDDLKTCIWKLKQKKPLIPSKKCSQFNGCSHGCITDLHGFPKCTCPTGYELHDDLKTCIWKLKQKKPLIPSKQCSQFNGCSHGCIMDLHGFPKCTCPTGYELHDDHKTCIWKFKQKEPLIPSKQCSQFNGCSHGCIMDLHGFPKCTCPTGYELHDDHKTCIWKFKQKEPLIPSKQCSPFNGCSHGCITDLHGFPKCTCPTGYVLHDDHKTCIWKLKQKNTEDKLCKLYPSNCNICKKYLFAPHPTSCDKFLQCDNFHKVFERKCATGTIWNQKIRSCVHGSCKH